MGTKVEEVDVVSVETGGGGEKVEVIVGTGGVNVGSVGCEVDVGRGGVDVEGGGGVDVDCRVVDGALVDVAEELAGAAEDEGSLEIAASLIARGENSTSSCRSRA